MIKLKSLNNNHSQVQVIYLLKSEISRMARNETENITYITMKNNDFPSYDVLETPEEILAMPDIETAEKAIDWEQRRYEIAREIFATLIPSTNHVINMAEVMNAADVLIDELKRG